ncbi:MAG TPA: HAMP domain-containing sensor histidine kinase [Chthoniobacterales bacterium]|nr:HAMP domain-containing sensor histidine kinase [Chthoniobacterales bacterium]
MIRADQANQHGILSFRTKLLLAMMLVVSALTGLGLYLAQRTVAANAERYLQQNFQSELSAVDKVLELRRAALAQRCRQLVSKPRIHAALEDNALDLLYPSAKDELRDLMEVGEPSSDQAGISLRARFYRFLDRSGGILPPPNQKDVGELSKRAESQLGFKKLPEIQQIGYISENTDATPEVVDEVVAVPIFSSETGELISTLVVGFKPFRFGNERVSGMRSGIWVDGHLHLPSPSQPVGTALASEITRAIMKSNDAQGNLRVSVDGAPQLLFYKRLNPHSLFSAAYEICVYPLADYMTRLRRLQWQISGGGALFLLAGFVASHLVAARFSVPVEKLEMDSATNRAERERAEAALVSASEELKRSSQYSADASHQLKSPVTILRTGIEMLLAREDFKPEIYEELSALLHQTHRLTGVIDDLLLLSRMDAGHLQIESAPVNLSQLVEEWLDDLSALPESPEVRIEKKLPPDLYVTGEKRYTSLIVQNLLENAWKYNRPGGQIRVVAFRLAEEVRLKIGNTGRPIVRNLQEHIFERFHHTSDASGHGLGLNLARELALLHRGDLKLVCSKDDWTEFELCLRGSSLAKNCANPPG